MPLPMTPAPCKDVQEMTKHETEVHEQLTRTTRLRRDFELSNPPALKTSRQPTTGDD